MPKVLYLKGFWTFRVCADVSHCFHSASTGADTTTGVADTTAGTAVSQKNGERFTENSERFSENGERFILATAVSYSGTANTATATAIPRAGTAISRTYIICERVVKRSWNVLNAPAPPQSFYLLRFRQIRGRWNLFFENLFFLEKHTEGLRGKDPLSPSVCLYSYHAPSHWKCSRRGLHTDSCR